MLVLCADHELNVSSFTARCVASAGSSPYAVVSAGLSALEGPKHGGSSVRAEAMLDRVPIGTEPARRARRAAGPRRSPRRLRPSALPRRAIRAPPPSWPGCGRRGQRSPELAFVLNVVRAATAVTGERPNLDFGLAAAARVLRLPPGAPLMLFAIGRTIGWIGHALEQYATGQLIRPRAKYVGPAPLA